MQNFLNEEERYEGPLLVNSAALSACNCDGEPVISLGARIVVLREDSAQQAFYGVEEFVRELI
jgi:hypothetical protein